MKVKKKLRVRKRKGSKKQVLYNPYVHGVSQSVLGTYLDCREKCRLACLLGLRSAGYNPFFSFGGMSHYCLDQAYTGMINGYKLVDVIHHLPTWVEDAEKEYWEKNKEMRHNSRAAIEVETQSAILLPELTAYFEHWYQQDSKTRWLQTEKEFRVDVHLHSGRTVPIVGAIDGVYSVGKHGCGLFETKNKSRYSRESLELLSIDLQLNFYIPALHALYPNRNVTECRYNLIKRPSVYRRKEETLKQYVERCGDLFRADPKKFFERVHLDYTESDLWFAHDQTVTLLDQFLDWYDKLDRTDPCVDRNPHHCEYGYSLCSYWRSCVNDDRTGLVTVQRPHQELSDETVFHQ